LVPTVAVGVKTKVTVQEEPLFRIPLVKLPQVVELKVKSEALVPLKVALVKLILEPELLDNVATIPELEVNLVTVPKFRLVGEKAGGVTATPVPLNADV
jgi:hypothetical protein